MHYAFRLDEAGAPALTIQERAASEHRSIRAAEDEEEALPSDLDL